MHIPHGDRAAGERRQGVGIHIHADSAGGTGRKRIRIGHGERARLAGTGARAVEREARDGSAGAGGGSGAAARADHAAESRAGEGQRRSAGRIGIGHRIAEGGRATGDNRDIGRSGRDRADYRSLLQIERRPAVEQAVGIAQVADGAERPGERRTGEQLINASPGAAASQIERVACAEGNRAG